MFLAIKADGGACKVIEEAIKMGMIAFLAGLCSMPGIYCYAGPITAKRRSRQPQKNLVIRPEGGNE
jgi:hypothetical protein